jgi:hypothetical protein
MKVERQPKCTCSQPPRIGAIAGARPNTIMMFDIIFCASAPAEAVLHDGLADHRTGAGRQALQRAAGQQPAEGRREGRAEPKPIV